MALASPADWTAASGVHRHCTAARAVRFPVSAQGGWWGGIPATAAIRRRESLPVSRLSARCAGLNRGTMLTALKHNPMTATPWRQVRTGFPGFRGARRGDVHGTYRYCPKSLVAHHADRSGTVRRRLLLTDMSRSSSDGTTLPCCPWRTFDAAFLREQLWSHATRACSASALRAHNPHHSWDMRYGTTYLLPLSCPSLHSC